MVGVSVIGYGCGKIPCIYIIETATIFFGVPAYLILIFAAIAHTSNHLFKYITSDN